MAITAFRDVVAYEQKLKKQGEFDDDNMADYDSMLSAFANDDGRYDDISDEDIFQALRFLVESTVVNCVMNPPSQLQNCGNCGKEEKMFGDWKKCSKCQEMSYCSKECQSNDWPLHKQLCGKRNTTNIESSSILGITKILVKNHSATVEMRSGRPVPGHLQEKAEVALVKQLKKMFTGDFQKFNNVRACADAGSDPDFQVVLADFFAEQPGYEKVWGTLRVGYKEYLEMKQEMEQATNGLNVDEESIRAPCVTVVDCLMLRVGEFERDMLGESLRDKLVDDLVALIKDFAMEFPQFNSYSGLQKMFEDDTFKVRMATTIGSALAGVEADD